MRRDITRRSAVLVLLLAGLILVAQAQELRLPNKEGSLKFAVIGDSGHPGTGQTAVARQMASWRTRFPFEFALMTGDNLYAPRVRATTRTISRSLTSRSSTPA